MPEEEEDTIIRIVNPLLDSMDEGEAAYLVVLSGKAVGQMVRAARGTIRIGRHPDNDIVLDDDGVSRFHAEITTDNKRQSRIRDLGSTNGTFVEVNRVSSEKPTPLKDGQRIRVGPATILKYGYRDTVEHQFLSRLYRSATRDGLTGCYKREYFLDHLDGEVAWHRRHDEWLSLLMIDLDHFKKINDTWGHQVGDDVLHEFAGLLKKQCRVEDLIARYGGEEFAVVLRRTTEEEGSLIAERVRQAVADHEFLHRGKRIALTCSIGVLSRKGEDLTTSRAIVRDADALLYEAKDAGRDAVRSSGGG